MGGTGQTSGSGGSGTWSREPEDLSNQWALEQCETIEFEGVERPYVGKTALLAELGRGGMGIVYFGVNPRLNTEVAIKVLPARIQKEKEESVERFVREARLAAQLQSPHLVRVLDVDQDEKSGAHYIVMEYVRGKSARELIGDYKKQKGVPEKDALAVAIATTKGLKAAHMEGILHRDVKPHNILIPANDEGKLLLSQAKLADLGLARHESPEDEITNTQMGMGTPGYTSPEQATDARSATKRSDVFGVGATLYALLAKRRPYAGTSPVDIVINTMKGEYKRIREFRPDVSQGTAALLERCLSPNAGDRFADAPALLEALNVCHRALTQPAKARAANAEQQVIKLLTRKERGKRIAAARHGRPAPRRTPGRPLAPMRRRRRQSTSSAVTIGLIAVGLVAAIIMVMKGGGGTEAGGLFVASTPSGATVLVDGRERGTTPVTINGLSGTHHVQLRLEGYRTHNVHGLVIEEGALVQLGPVLQADGGTWLEIESEPMSATVLIDGRARGKTPLEVRGLDPGTHSVELRKDGYASHKKDYALAKGKSTKVSVTLQPSRGTLTLVGAPANATVTLDRNGRKTNLKCDAKGEVTAGLRGGTYTLTIAHDGYEPYTRTVTIGEEPTTHAVKMQAGRGRLTVRSTPPDCEVFVDGKRYGKTPLNGVSIPAGRRQVKVRHPDYSEFEKEVDVSVGGVLDLGNVKLLAASTIELSAVPDGTIATIDGLQVQSGDRIRPGKHTLTLKRAGYATQKLEIEAVPGKSTLVQPGQWVRPQARLNIHPLPADARAFVDGKDVTGGTIVRYRPDQVEVTIRRPGYEEVKVRRTLVMNRTLKLPIDIRWTRVITYLDLSALPHGTQLMIDRKRYGHRAQIPAGNHVAKLVIDNKRTTSFKLSVVSQDTVRPPLPLLDAKPVVRALEWFKIHQDPTGNWGAMSFPRQCPQRDRCTGFARIPNDAGVSGLALLCFLNAGRTHEDGEYIHVVRKGLKAILKRQSRSGGLGMPGVPYYAWNHGYAALALVEAYRMTQDEDLWIPAQKAVNYTMALRTNDLGWRYQAGGGESDTSVTGLMVQVLKAAEAAGLDVEKKAFDGALEWITRMTDPGDGRVGYLSRGGLPWRRQGGFAESWPADKSESMTAVGNVARFLLGAKKTDQEIVNGARLCLKMLPEWWYSTNPVDLSNIGQMRPGVSHIDHYYWYYGSLFAYHLGGTHQKKWDRALRKALLKKQRTRGHLAGSWDPFDPFCLAGGRVYSTAMCCLALEWGYRTQSLK